MPSPFFKYLEWDSKILGISCGKIVCGHLPRNMDQSILAENIEKIIFAYRELDFITIKLPFYFPSIVDKLSNQFDLFVDTELIYKYKRTENVIRTENVSFFYQFAPEAFLPLAKEMIHSRFFLDERIPNNKAQKLWEESLRNHCGGKADRLAIASVNNNPAGLITLNFLKNNLLDLHVVGVLKQYQGQGLGNALLAKITQEYAGSHEIVVETQTANKPAQGLYKASGFSLDSKRYILHVWP